MRIRDWSSDVCSSDLAAERETLEEACGRVRDLQLYTLFDLPHINQVYMFFRAELVDLDFCAGDESLEVKLFHQQDIPWSAGFSDHRPYPRMLLRRPGAADLHGAQRGRDKL